MRNKLLDPTRQRHGALAYTGHCYACGADIRYLAARDKCPRFYCSQACMGKRPPKMALAEQAWDKPFAELALEHLNSGGSLNALADMCGVHRQALYVWLERAGIVRHVEWRQREVAS